MTDTLILLAALTAFAGLLLGWMLLPLSTGTEELDAPSGRPATVPV